MIDQEIALKAHSIVQELYGQTIDPRLVQLEKTNREFTGDYTLVVFPLLRISRKSPQETAGEIGEQLLREVPEVASFEVVKGFLNLKVRDEYWLNFMRSAVENHSFGIRKPDSSQPVVLEYSSPNTNKPLHLGHIRNNLLGYSLSKILEANGKKVIRLNLINDRGIHICKSMLAWIKWGNGETPENSGIKGDHLVGKYYVLFDKKHKEEIEQLVHRGYTEDDAYDAAPLMREAKMMLRKWENADEEVLTVWHKMNQWAYDGFDVTYKRLGVAFDAINYESKIYLEGRQIVLDGLAQGLFYQHDDGSVWVNLTAEGLDEKLLLRSDGTSLYITQDIGTAESRYNEYRPSKLIYVVGNEQIYHFDVLKKVMKLLKRPWWDRILHLSYGMVELPQGRMKSREGTVVDADDLMDEMLKTARKTTEELGKTEEFSSEERAQLYQIIGMGALKYYILKVDPRKNMMFNPEESIDFNGNTGPFIQYTYARIQSMFRKAPLSPDEYFRRLDFTKVKLLDVERSLIRQMYEFPLVVEQAGENYNPALIANYVYELVKTYNSFYQDTPILKRVDEETSIFRMTLSWFTGRVIKCGMDLLAIELPERM